MKYFKVFNTEAEYLEYAASYDFLTPNVSTLRDCTHTWITAEQHSFEEDYFTVESLEDNNTITFTRLAGGGDIASYFVDVSTDDGETWETVEIPFIEQTNDIVTLNTGEKALFKYSSGGRLCRDLQSCMLIGSDQDFKVYGNVMSLSRTDFTGNTTAWDNEFVNLFSGSTHLVSAENLIIPSTSTDYHCYCNMFKGCTSLEYPPSIYATNMSTGACEYMFSGCTSLLEVPSMRVTGFSGHVAFRSMFEGCTSLTTVPSDYLSVTSIAGQECDSMFKGCTSLTTAPELPATTFSGGGCYRSMFSGCTSLTTAPELPATTLTDDCYRDMFSDCTSLTTVPSTLSATTMANNCYRAMFCRCTSLTTAPVISATTMAEACCQYMFLGCSGLTTAPSTLLATTLDNNCYYGMFGDCKSLVTPPTIQATTVDGSCCCRMFSGCTSLTTAPELHSSTMKANCYTSMFHDCTSLTVAPTLSATSLDNYCYSDMFYGCSGLTTPPSSLPALSIPKEAYKNMFNNCSSLQNMPQIAATTVGNNGCEDMFSACTSLTTATTLHFSSIDANGCIQMFRDCTSLVTPPSVISASTIGNKGCENMFMGCTSLTTAPEISAISVGASACTRMFSGCTSLTTAPELPATTLADSCYREMFKGCSSLTSAPELPATTLADSCYREMFKGCSSLTSVPLELPATTLAANCYREMFRWCATLTTAPEISATTVSNYSCGWMFSGCSGLTAAPSVLPATTLAEGCYSTMFGDCKSLTVAPELPAQTLVDRCYYDMFNNSNVSYIKCLATDISATECTYHWFYRVPNVSGRTFVKNSIMEDWTRDENGILSNWTVHDDTYVTVTGVTLNTGSTTVNKGNTYALTATVLPSNADDKVVTWSTSDLSVATVVDGVVTGAGCGSAIITVTTHEGSYTAQCVVTVENHVTAVDLNTYVATINTSGTYHLIETITPSDACNKSVTWSSNNPSVATVDTDGVVSGVATGSATVTVTTVDGGYTKSCAVTVNEGQHATAVTLSDASISLEVNSAYTLTATVLPADAVNKNVTWLSSDSAIASVDSSGVVSGVASGDATITVTTVDGGFTAQCSVSVTNIHDYSKDYFTIESLEDSNDVKIHRWGKSGNTEFYSLDNGTTWTQVPTGSSEITIATINSGETVLIKSEAQEWASRWDLHNSLTCSKNYNVYGNIMSLTYGDDFLDKTTIKNPSNSGGTFMGLFWYTSSSAATAEGSTTLISAENLVLPATTLKTRVYNEMFRGCVNLQYPPKELPATTLVQECYGSMFELCRSLRVAPVIKAEDTARSCCQRMFCMSRNGATAVDSALITAPVLLPKTLEQQSYQEMFAGNKNLNYIKCLATGISAASALTNWVSSVSETGTFVKDQTMVSWGVGKSGIPSGWVVSDYVIKSFYISAATDSVVSFTNNLQYSYNNETWMALSSNTNLTIQTDEKVYFKSIITPTSTNGIGHFSITGSVSVGGNPSSLMVGDAIESLNGYDYAFKGLLSGCTSITSVSNLMMHKTLSTSCYEGMLCGCTNLTTAPKLPASTLVSDCYKEMFSGCTSLNYIEALFLTEPSTSYTNNWVSGVAASGEFKRDIEIVWDVESNRGVNGIPQSWDVGYGYIELGYIASTKTGGQYIDLDIKLYETLNTWYDIAIMYNVFGAGQDDNQPTLFGCQNQSSPYPGTFIRMNNNVATSTIGRYIGGGNKDNDLGSNGYTHELPVQTAPSKNVRNLNNGGQTHSFGTSLFCAFSDASNTPFKFIEARLMYFKLFLKPDADTQGTLTRDMIPCKTSNGTVGLFDKVGKKLYTSPNNAVFEAVPEINS